MKANFEETYDEYKLREIIKDEIKRNHRCWNCSKIMKDYDGFCSMNCRLYFFDEIFEIEKMKIAQAKEQEVLKRVLKQMSKFNCTCFGAKNLKKWLKKEVQEK